MFASLINGTQRNLLVHLVSDDLKLGARLGECLGESRDLLLKQHEGRLAASPGAWSKLIASSVLVIDLDPDNDAEVAALEQFVASQPNVPPIIVVSPSVESANARRLLKLRLADWLPKDASPTEFRASITSVESQPHERDDTAKCYAFMPAVGGAGASTLCITAASLLSEKQARSKTLPRTCIVDLNLQHSSIVDYLDLAANLKFEEFAGAPERLDQQLLEVMLSRKGDGPAVLAAAPKLRSDREVGAREIGQLLDLTASAFDSMIVDLPRNWSPWTETILRGADHHFIVTEQTVAGLRHAKWLADTIAEELSLDSRGTIIVSKSTYWSRAGVSRKHAREALGERMVGHISDVPELAHEAQNRGLMLSHVKSRNRIERDLSTILQRVENPLRQDAS